MFIPPNHPTLPETTPKTNFGYFDPIWMKLGGDHPNHFSTPIPSWTPVLFRFLSISAKSLSHRRSHLMSPVVFGTFSFETATSFSSELLLAFCPSFKSNFSSWTSFSWASFSPNCQSQSMRTLSLEPLMEFIW